jgi:2-iminobutanoate/2-iminopropanoate deaminase
LTYNPERRKAMAHEILKLKTVHSTHGYSHVAKAGKTLYIAGQVAKNAQGNLVGKGDFEAQARQAFANLENILRESGGTLKNIVKMTTFLTHFGYSESFRRVRGEFFKDPFPPNTLVIVESLASEEFMVEVEAIAVLD